MNSEPPNLNDDGIPSFQAIVEKDLGRPEGLPITWQSLTMIPEAVLHQLLPHYEGWQFLGHGGMGVVYKAWHRELMRWSAIKFLSPNLCSDPRAMARFQNEAMLLAQLRHPHIVPVHDFGCEGDLAWLVMDFVDGVPLQLWAKENPRKPAEFALMVAKIARAVGVAHASGITHRDLKPGNILVVEDQPVLLDFGLAQNIAWQEDTRLTQIGELAGTIAYLSPEQVEPSLGEPTPATDVHACGVILFELLSGQLPRMGLASQIITRLHEDESPPQLRAVVKSVRKELDAICWRSMQRTPEARYANGISLAEDLERFLDGRPVRAKNPDLVDIVYLFIRRYPWALAAVSIAVMALMVAAWSTGRMQWSQRKARLLSQINHQLTESDWTPDLLIQTDELLVEMKRVDSVLERYLKEAVLKRTLGASLQLLDSPRLSAEQSFQLRKLLEYLMAKKHPESAALMRRWQLHEQAWQTRLSLVGPITRESAEKVFRLGGWEAKLERLQAIPKTPEETWSTLFGKMEIDGAVELELEFAGAWQKAKACGVNLSIPLLKDPRFYVYQADRFAQYQPDFVNPEKAPVMAIMSENTPLVYAVLPREVRQSPRLVMRCRYENGELSMEVNDGDPLHFTGIFELARPLAETYFSVLLPVESSLARVELRQRTATAQAMPLAKADDLISAGKAEEALPIYERYLNRADIRVECRYKYAACLETLQRPKDAILAWEQVARSREEPWKSLSMYQLWRSQLGQGNLANANAWFDLLMAGKPPEIIRTGIPTADRLLLNQHYLPITRSINCLKARPVDMAELDRAVRVQQFLGADSRQIALRTALAFHFAGQDQRARQYLSQAVISIRPSAAILSSELYSTLLCLDQWATLGAADSDAVLQATITAWIHALHGSTVPVRAIPLLEDLRHELRLGLPFKKGHRETLRELVTDPQIMTRHRLEACLIQGQGESSQELRQKAWQEATRILDLKEGALDRTQQSLHVEFMVRSLNQNWTANLAAEWVAIILGKARPLISQENWIGPTIQSLAGESLARALNQTLQNERGLQFARDYTLRTRTARELAHESMELILLAIYSEGTGLPKESRPVRETAAKMVTAFCERELSEVATMQFFTLWNGVKNQATWEMMADGLKPDLLEPMKALLTSRYEKLGRFQEAAEFAQPPVKEKPAPKTTRVDP